MSEKTKNILTSIIVILLLLIMLTCVFTLGVYKIKEIGDLEPDIQSELHILQGQYKSLQEDLSDIRVQLHLIAEKPTQMVTEAPSYDLSELIKEYNILTWEYVRLVERIGVE
jgi:predicted PurR-regulated permease PerM